MKGENEAFVDPHHTPEMVVAISDLSGGFFGFSPISAIRSFLGKVPDLRDAIGNEADTNGFLSGDLTRQRELLEMLFWDIFSQPRRMHVEHYCLECMIEGAALGNQGKV